MPAPIAEDVKAQIIAALLAGGAVNEVARKYRLDKSTVSRIRAGLSPEALQQVATEKRVRIDDILLECMQSNLEALKRIADASSERDYIRDQPAESVAVLYGQIAGVTIRLLEAASAAGVGDENAEPTETQ